LELGSEGFANNDIVILSTHNDQNAVVNKIDQPEWKDRIRPYDLTSRNKIGFCSIHSFKGMESPVIIVTDVEQLDRPQF